MKIHTLWVSGALCVLQSALAAPVFAAPVFANPLTTSAFVEAFAVNSYIQPGIARNMTGSGPIADAASALYGTSTADSSASVTAKGLHAAASVHNTSAVGGSASARSLAGIVNPFFIVPKVGFVGNQATLQISYHLGGALNDSSNCPTCAEFVQANLGVDGIARPYTGRRANTALYSRALGPQVCRPCSRR